MPELEKTYDASKVESAIYKKWLNSGYFNPDDKAYKKLPGADERKKREPYTIIMPPPNANAPLHAGHALFLTIEDILTRYQRMRGRRALWLPSTDHAGFETQVVFEKKLEKEGRSRFTMSREDFYKEIWDFVQDNKHLSEDGIKRLGASCDWSRNIFTLDGRIIKIVYETFKQMYDDGLIYRGNRICNWCPKHQTALSDLETKYEEREDILYYLKYGPFTIATARPETKFGDKFVVMHPKDKRYAKYKDGQKIDLEWINGPITATVVKDDSIDMEFGTGVMTITPWHDAADFEIAQRHNLDMEQIIDKTGKLLPIAGEFAGQHIKKARPLIVEKLRGKDLLDENKTNAHYKHNVSVCYKCKTPIEPQIIPQWYVNMTKEYGGAKKSAGPGGTNKQQSLRDQAVAAVKNSAVKIIPRHFEKIYFNWMNNIVDWPISRQIWWGISIPAWYCGSSTDRTVLKMGFHESVVPQVLSGKTKTYRTRDHNFQVGSRIVFENTQTKQIFGYGLITKVLHTTVGQLPLNDPAHGAVYDKRGQLIAAFKRHHPEQTIDETTPVVVYEYEFAQINKAASGCGEIIIAEKPPKQCPKCGGKNLEKDPDTFDTWFSSGQWPYAALLATGGPKDLDTYYPTSVMETGWDILFFWVARMIMFGFYKTGKAPFSTVYLHGLVRDKDRQKMSKSKGNVVDPLGVIDTYGTDALRFALIFSTAAGNDIPLSEDKIRGMKHFANKLWNIARFIISNSDQIYPETDLQLLSDSDFTAIIELHQINKNMTEHLENLRLHEAAQSIYQFTWHRFADVHIEESKALLQNPETSELTQKRLQYVLKGVLRLLHPFMPFVTEEIWGMLDQKKLLMITPWPEA